MNNSNVRPLTRGLIDQVESHDGTLSVTAEFGKRSINADEVRPCLDEENLTEWKASSKFLPQTKIYRIDFIFNGNGYHVAPLSAATAAIFAHD